MSNDYVSDDDLEFDEDLRTLNGVPFTGIAASYYPDKAIESTTPFVNGLPHGKCTEWFSGGTRRKEWHSLNGEAHGAYAEWFENGSVRISAKYAFGVEVEFQEFDANGKKILARELDSNSSIYAYLKKREKMHLGDSQNLPNPHE